jgi:hypothetical protein
MTSSRVIRIALIGDHNPEVTTHQAIPLDAIRFARETGRPFLGAAASFPLGQTLPV